MDNSPPKFRELLHLLAEHAVDFIVVGNVSAVLQGAPVSTFDLDLVHSRDPANVERLLAVLPSIGAHYRHQHGRYIVPGASHLSSPGHQLLNTKLGPLDLLGTVGEAEGYEELLPLARMVEVEVGMSVRVLDLEAIIRLKEAAGRDKDKAVLPVLRRTLEERRRLASDPGGPAT